MNTLQILTMKIMGQRPLISYSATFPPRTITADGSSCLPKRFYQERHDEATPLLKAQVQRSDICSQPMPGTMDFCLIDARNNIGNSMIVAALILQRSQVFNRHYHWSKLKCLAENCVRDFSVSVSTEILNDKPQHCHRICPAYPIFVTGADLVAIGIPVFRKS